MEEVCSASRPPGGRSTSRFKMSSKVVEGASAVDMMAAAMASNEEAESVLRQHRRKGIPLKALPGLNEHKSSQNIPSNVQQAPRHALPKPAPPQHHGHF